MASIPALEPLVIDGPPSALAARWKEWVDRLETYFAATAVENDQCRPMLLHLGGAAVHKLGQSVVEEGPPYTYQSLKQALTAHFEPLANPDYERFLLRQARQFPHESVDAFYARLQDLSRTCTLVDVEDEVCAQFIQGCTSVKLREHILQVPGMSMVNILTLGRSKELSKVRAAHMEAALQMQVKVELMNAVTTAPGERKKYKSKTSTSPRFGYSCGGSFPHQGLEGRLSVLKVCRFERGYLKNGPQFESQARQARSSNDPKSGNCERKHLGISDFFCDNYVNGV
ncbi:hypothetical protein NDU88_005594 [Pleurodeles waltl]|uniref:Retrotransposon gag domain-containing protein n=1 Tax=Pleurodeles waltl TaxID=8319 RepID=A0AAV7PFU9_PLEWA|nr:hypothetical protein NDU88_005594 [Pleurodeles waltl]